MYKCQSLTKSLKKGCIVNITHSMCIPDNLATSPNLRQCEENEIEKKNVGKGNSSSRVVYNEEPTSLVTFELISVLSDL